MKPITTRPRITRITPVDVYKRQGHYWFDLGAYLEDEGILLVMVNPYAVKQTKELDDNSQSKNDRKGYPLIQ